MRYIATLVISLLCIYASFGQNRVQSGAYNWSNSKPYKEDNRIRRQLLEGETTTLAELEIHTSTVEAGEAPHAPHAHTDVEELVIVIVGELKATIQGKGYTMIPGSIAYAMPGDQHGFINSGNVPCTYYIIKFKSKAPVDLERGKKSGGSFVVEWSDLKFTPHDKGGRRNVVDRPTALFKRFEMHVTTLNKGLISHDPHSHPAEEIILVRSGDTQMQVGEAVHSIEPSSMVFVDSRVLHNLRNTGDSACEYFAFQWEP